MVSAVSVSALNAGIGSSIGIGLKCSIGTSLPFLSHTNLLFQKLNFLKIKDIVKLEMAKTMFCFNKNSAKNESQTIVSITQKHDYKTRLAAQQNYFQPKKRDLMTNRAS